MVVRPASEVCYKYHIYIYNIYIYIYNVHIIHKPGVSQVGAVVSLFLQGLPSRANHQIPSTNYSVLLMGYIALTAGS